MAQQRPFHSNFSNGKDCLLQCSSVLFLQLDKMLSGWNMKHVHIEASIIHLNALSTFYNRWSINAEMGLVAGLDADFAAATTTNSLCYCRNHIARALHISLHDYFTFDQMLQRKYFHQILSLQLLFFYPYRSRCCFFSLCTMHILFQKAASITKN